jgi:hypothetical protein
MNIYQRKQFKPFKKFQSFKPLLDSFPATRGRI